ARSAHAGPDVTPIVTTVAAAAVVPCSLTSTNDCWRTSLMYRARPADGEMPLKSASPPVNAMPMPNALRAGWRLAPRQIFLRASDEGSRGGPGRQLSQTSTGVPSQRHGEHQSASLSRHRTMSVRRLRTQYEWYGGLTIPRGFSAVRILRLQYCASVPVRLASRRARSNVHAPSASSTVAKAARIATSPATALNGAPSNSTRRSD